MTPVVKWGDMIELATDGSTGAIPRPYQPGAKAEGGWAFVVMRLNAVDPVWQESGYESQTTISRMELTAAIKGLEWVEREFYTPVDNLTVVTDSAYVRNCFKDKWYVKWQSNGWINSSKQPVANRDLWEQLLALHELIQPNWRHVKGHQGRHDGNALADELAVKARKGR